jgi:hypothetical protein
MFKTAVELRNYNRRMDKSVTLRVDTTFEMKPQDIAEIDSHLGDVGVLVLSDTPQGNDLDMEEILKDLEVDKDIPKKKSPSRRFRDILWRLLEQRLGRKPSEEEFGVFYRDEYDKICSHYLDKFEDDKVV